MAISVRRNSSRTLFDRTLQFSDMGEENRRASRRTDLRPSWHYGSSHSITVINALNLKLRRRHLSLLCYRGVISGPLSLRSAHIARGDLMPAKRLLCTPNSLVNHAYPAYVQQTSRVLWPLDSPRLSFTLYYPTERPSMSHDHVTARDVTLRII